MAIAEARVGVLPRVVERTPSPAKPKLEFAPIEYPRMAAKELARRFMKDRLWTKGLKPGEINSTDAQILGIIEVQGQFFSMLGQDHLLNGVLDRDPIIVQLKPITKQNIESLGGSYRAARRFYVDRDIELKEWQADKSRGQVTPDEARILGRMYELARILVELGQQDLVELIDAQIGRSPNQIKWEEMRKAAYTHKGELF